MLGALVLQDVQDILGHGHLVGELEHVGLRLVLLLQVQVAHALQIGNLMVHLEGGDAVVHSIEVLLDEQQTVVDEARGAACHLVLLGQPSFIEGLQNGAEHLFGAAR